MPPEVGENENTGVREKVVLRMVLDGSCMILFPGGDTQGVYASFELVPGACLRGRVEAEGMFPPHTRAQARGLKLGV